MKIIFCKESRFSQNHHFTIRIQEQSLSALLAKILISTLQKKGQITAYPRQLHSLIRLAEAHAKMRFSKWVEVSDVEEAKRLHREALKQSAVDPKTGRIDVGILTTGYSSEDRKTREQTVQTLKKLIKDKGKITTLKKEVLYQDLLTQSDLHIQRDHFENALRDLQEDDFLIITDQIIRILSN
jgi:DNA replication licensing factor MCM4